MIHTFIPSLQRPDRQLTAAALDAANLPFTIVRRDDDTTTYPTFEHGNTFVTEARGIRATRQRILESFGGLGKFCIVDDDMNFRVPEGDQGKSRPAEAEDVVEMYEYIDGLLDEFAQVGIADRFRIHNRKKPYGRTGKVVNITFFNTKLWPKDNWPSYRTEIFEDLDITLQLFERGLDNAVIANYCWATVRNARGGCNVWRNEEVLKAANEHFCSLWPGVVRSINGSTRVHVLWQKALRLGKSVA